jgi:hypothetical protein
VRVLICGASIMHVLRETESVTLVAHGSRAFDLIWSIVYLLTSSQRSGPTHNHPPIYAVHPPPLTAVEITGRREIATK